MPGAAPADFHTNTWVDYKGVQRTDGVVEVEYATFAANGIQSREAKLRADQEYDPAAVSPTAKQGAVSRYFRGLDRKQIPPYVDVELQARINRIGESLIPAYQKDLLPDDPTRIHFRFQLVDEPKWPDAFTSPSGIILVPRQVVERLKNDSQVAAVLADNIATALEKQEFRDRSALLGVSAAEAAGNVGGIFVPGLGIATWMAGRKVQKTMLAQEEVQSGRVALSLMHDAGYDLREAPEAWWILASKPSKQGVEARSVSPPPRAQNQLQELGATWRTVLLQDAKHALAAAPMPAPSLH